MSELYSDDGIFGNFTYSGIGVSRGLVISFVVMGQQCFEIHGKIKILVVGAGSGYEVVNYLKHGHRVTNLDLYAPPVEKVRDVTCIGSADNMPFKDDEFDLVHCTEMLEHVPKEMTDGILNECKRVAKRFVFSIATRDDAPYNTHINIHPAWWWIRRFEDLGFEIVNAQQQARLAIPIKQYASVIYWPDGVFLHGKC